MAARRLLAILIVLLVISSFAAALAPQQRNGDDTTSTTTAPEEPTPGPSGGSTLVERIPADPPRPVVVTAAPGDQLALAVAAAEPSPVAVAGLGLRGFATDDDPARFDLLLRGEGSFPITVAGRPVGRIEVAAGSGKS